MGPTSDNGKIEKNARNDIGIKGGTSCWAMFSFLFLICRGYVSHLVSHLLGYVSHLVSHFVSHHVPHLLWLCFSSWFLILCFSFLGYVSHFCLFLVFMARRASGWATSPGIPRGAPRGVPQGHPGDATGGTPGLTRRCPLGDLLGDILGGFLGSCGISWGPPGGPP